MLAVLCFICGTAVMVVKVVPFTFSSISSSYASTIADGNSNRRAEKITLSASSSSKIAAPAPAALNTNTLYDVIILGSGPAGLSSSIFASRAGLNVLTLGSETGLLSEATRLDNYPSWIPFENNEIDSGGDEKKRKNRGGGEKWLKQTRKQASDLGVLFGPPGLLATSIQSTSTNNGSKYFEVGIPPKPSLKAKSIILATGSTPRTLSLPNESLLFGKSIHSCAICDGSYYKGKKVVIVGGGDAAIDAVLILSRFAREVVLVHRRLEFTSASDKRALKIAREDLNNVEILTPFVISEWLVEQNEGAEGGGIKLVGAKLKSSDGGKEEIRDIECDGAFVMIGAKPNTDFLRSSNVQLDSNGLVKILQHSSSETEMTMTTQTSVPGIFAAGEVVDGFYKQVATAVGDGARAAIDAERYIREVNGDGASVEKVQDKLIQKQRQPPMPKTADEKKELNYPIKTPAKTGAKQSNSNNARSNANTSLDGIRCDLTTKGCIQETTSAHPVVVFSKTYCPYCKRAIEKLKLEGAENLIIIDLTTPKYRQISSRIQDTLLSMTGRRTVPNVFVGGKSIGGGDETVALHASGKLHGLLVEAGAIENQDTELKDEKNFVIGGEREAFLHDVSEN